MTSKTIRIGEKEVTIAIEAHLHPVPVVALEARCDKVTTRKRITLSPKHDQTQEQFDKDIARAVQQVAEEAAGHARSHELLASLDPKAGDNRRKVPC